MSAPVPTTSELTLDLHLLLSELEPRLLELVPPLLQLVDP